MKGTGGAQRGINTVLAPKICCLLGETDREQAITTQVSQCFAKGCAGDGRRPEKELQPSLGVRAGLLGSCNAS